LGCQPDLFEASVGGRGTRRPKELSSQCSAVGLSDELSCCGCVHWAAARKGHLLRWRRLLANELKRHRGIYDEG